MGRLTLAVLNAAQHDAHFEEIRGLDVDVVHATYNVAWEEISQRRRGEHASEPENLPAELTEALARADLIFGFYVPRDLAALSPRLRWIETPSTGIDHLRGTGILESDVQVTTVGGLFAGVIAELAFAGMLYFAKRLAHYESLRRERVWQMGRLDGLEGKTLGLLGVGNIGQAVAVRARAFGMRVIGIGRRDPDGRSVPGVDRLLPSKALPELLAQADYLVVAVAGTPETRGMLGARELALLKPSAVLVNVARGTVIDEDALVEGLRNERIAGAALDVFAIEPLPAESPLWFLPNVLVTPHVAVGVSDYLPRAIGHLTQNVRRFLAREPLLDQLDASRGY